MSMTCEMTHVTLLYDRQHACSIHHAVPSLTSIRILRHGRTHISHQTHHLPRPPSKHLRGIHPTGGSRPIWCVFLIFVWIQIGRGCSVDVVWVGAVCPVGGAGDELEHMYSNTPYMRYVSVSWHDIICACHDVEPATHATHARGTPSHATHLWSIDLHAEVGTRPPM